MTLASFCCLVTCRCSSGILAEVVPMTRSFFLLRDTSIVEIFSSEKTTSPVCVPFCIFSSKTWLLSSLFGVCCSVRWWRLRRRKKIIFRPSRTSLFIDVGEMPALAAIFVSDRLGFLLIFILVFFTTSWARADRGRPLLGSSSTLPFRRNFF